MRLAGLPAVFVFTLASASACSKPAALGSADAGGASRPRYGAVMAEVGRRWELAGRAAVANRFELAAFEIGEIEELFAEELARAELPKEGPSAQLPALASAWVNTHPPALEKAADRRDGAAFAAEFERASRTCNVCHEASAHGFLEVPTVAGKGVPNLDPLPAPSAGR
jgi:hypothetical protein